MVTAQFAKAALMTCSNSACTRGSSLVMRDLMSSYFSCASFTADSARPTSRCNSSTVTGVGDVTAAERRSKIVVGCGGGGGGGGACNACSSLARLDCTLARHAWSFNNASRRASIDSFAARTYCSACFSGARNSFAKRSACTSVGARIVHAAEPTCLNACPNPPASSPSSIFAPFSSQSPK